MANHQSTTPAGWHRRSVTVHDEDQRVEWSLEEKPSDKITWTDTGALVGSGRYAGKTPQELLQIFQSLERATKH